jgi:hypothetical protein
MPKDNEVEYSTSLFIYNNISLSIFSNLIYKKNKYKNNCNNYSLS